MSDIGPFSNSAGRPHPPSIPDHELLRTIGRGAYGEVWLARSVTGAYRAVKIVTRSSFDHERPFEREFEGILRFEPISRQHESQVDILHVGRGDGYFYYVMELADDVVTGGQINPENYSPRTLKSDVFQRSRVPFDECVQIGIALATALENLHENGLVHRDVKPSNIIFVNSVPKLADIGLVTGVDATHTYVGTEGFAAPEGSGTPQADIYSLGKVLYEIATGKDRQEFPELPTQLRELPDREGLLELNAVIARACRHDPTERYVSATEMRTDLEFLQSGKSLARLHRMERRLRGITRAAITSGALAAIIVVAWWYQSLQTREARRLAEQNRKIAEDNRRLADENRDRVIQLHTANGIRHLEGNSLGAAMLSFAEALRKSSDDSDHAEVNRFRLGALLQMHAKPVAILSLNETNMDRSPFVVAQNGDRMLARTGAGLELWELALPPKRMLAIPDSANWDSFHITPDGKHLVLLSRTRRAQIWTVERDGSARVVETSEPLKPVSDRVECDFTRQMKYLPGITSNRVVRVFDCGTGLPKDSGIDVRDYAERSISRDGNWMAFRYSNGLVRLIDATNFRVLDGPVLGPEWEGVFPVFDGRRLLSRQGRRGSPQKLQVWEVASGRPVGGAIEYKNSMFGQVFDPAMTRVAIANLDQTARVWSLATGDPVSPILRHPASVFGVALSPDQARIATSAADGMVRVWDVDSGRLILPPMFHGHATRFLDFACGGSLLVAADSTGLLCLWDLAGAEVSQDRLAVAFTAEWVHFSPDGELLLASGNRQTGLWRTKNWERIDNRELTDRRSLGFNPDGHLVVVQTNGVRLWDVLIAEPKSPLIPVTFSESTYGSYSATEFAQLSPDGTVRFSTWRDGHPPRPDWKFKDAVWRLDWSRSGERMLVATENAKKELWAILCDSNGIPVGPALFTGGTHTFSPDGKWFACRDTAASLEVEIRESETGKLLAAPLRASSWWRGMSFSADNKRLVAYSDEGTVAILDCTSWSKLATVSAGGDRISAVRFMQNGRAFVVHTRSGKVRWWVTDSGEPLTPWLDAGGNGARVAIHPTRIMFAAAVGGRINIQEFGPPSSSSDTLIAMTRLVTRMPLEGGTTILSGDEYRQTHDALWSRHPEFFQISSATLAQWHENQAIAKTSWSEKAEKVLFHLDRQMVLQPERIELRERRAKLANARIPARDSAASSSLIDLSDYYTDSLDYLLEGDLGNLPRGIQHFAGTDFDIRGMIVLRHAANDTPAPRAGEQISHIRVAQRCAKLQFLHAAIGRSSSNAEVARIVVNYSDGITKIFPIHYGRHVRHWRRVDPGPGNSVSDSVIAWESSAEEASPAAPVSRLYKTTWENPRSDVEITHLEYVVSRQNSVSPFVVAITAE